MNRIAPDCSFHGLTLLRRCGAGAYGEVWLCRDLTGSRLAVKLIRKGREIPELRGVTAIRRALPSHPGILAIHHIDEDDDFLWYTMDAADSLGADPEHYLPDTLGNRLRRQIPVDAVAVMKQLIAAVTALHQAGIVHRDIKPDNILFIRGRAVLGDIGMAAPDISRLSLAGTLEFLPPEVRDGSASPGSVGKGGDLYALGKVLYCIISGNPPELFPSLPTGIQRSPLVGRLNHLACRVCDRTASLRLADETEFLRALEKIERLADTPESLSEKLARHRRVILGIASALCLAAAGTALLGWALRHLLAKPRTIIKEVPIPTPKPSDYPGKTATKLYRHSVYPLTATIPQEWLVFSAKTLEEKYAGNPQRAHDALRAMGISEAGVALFRNILEEKVELIFLSFREKSTDNITVRVFQVSEEARKEFLSTSTDEFRLNFARQLQRIFPAAKPAIYSAERIGKTNFTMLTLEYSVNPTEHRQKVVYFILRNHMIDFTLSASSERYAEYLPAFDRMIDSVRFDPESFPPEPEAKPAETPKKKAEPETGPGPASKKTPGMPENPVGKPKKMATTSSSPAPGKSTGATTAEPENGAFKTYLSPNRAFSAQIPREWVDAEIFRRETRYPGKRKSPRGGPSDAEEMQAFSDRINRFCQRYGIERRTAISFFQGSIDNRFDMIFCPNDGKRASNITLRMVPLKERERESLLRSAETRCGSAMLQRLAYLNRRNAASSGEAPGSDTEAPKRFVGVCRHTSRDGMDFFAVEGTQGNFHAKIVRVLTERLDVCLWFDAEPEAYRRHLHGFDHMIDTLKIEKPL